MVEALRKALQVPAEALEQGRLVVVTGPCRPALDPPLLSPLTGRPCLSFGIGAKELIWYTHRTGSKVEDRERWESRFSVTQQSDFYIDYEGRQIRVRMRPREFIFGGNPVTTQVEVKPGQPHPPGLKVLAVLMLILYVFALFTQGLFNPVNSEYSMGHWRYEDTSVFPEGVLTVVGVLCDERAELVIEPASREAMSPETVPGLSEAVWQRWHEVSRAPVVVISRSKGS